jgi:probable HAF family extracellular repeat protein
VSEYAITEVGPVPGLAALPLAINDSGVATGFVGDRSIYSTSLERPFLWDPASGALTYLPDPAGQGGYGIDINNKNQVVGYLNGPVGYGFLWDPVAGLYDFGAGPGREEVEATSINSQGKIAGSHGLRASLWDPSSRTFTDLGALPNATEGRAWAVNDNDEVVGASSWLEGEPIHGFLWKQGPGMQSLGDLGGGASVAVDINRGGEVVGYSRLANGDSHAFSWMPNSGVLTDLGPWTPRAVAADGTIVGLLEIAGGIQHACFWTRKVLKDLNNSIADTRWVLQTAEDINANGQIVGTGLLNGRRAGYLLTPAPLSKHDDIYAKVSRILGGVIDDKGGVYIGPDGRPHPIGPWDPRAVTKPGAQRDVVIGVVLSELGPLIHDKEARELAQRIAERLLGSRT